MPDPILEVENLHVHFDTYEGRQRVLDGVDLTIEEGETVALVGETGCGKSVTARTVMGMLPQPPGEIVDGRVRFRGEELLSNPSRHDDIRAQEMSMIFQDPMSHLSPVFTVGDAMTDVLKYGGKGELSWWELLRGMLNVDRETVRERRERCVEILRKLQIPDPEGILDRYPVELSGGMRQRVLIAMALLNDPPFIIADEPTTALDVTVQEQILGLLKERIEEQDLSVLYITHNLGVARELADRIYVMYAGSIAEYGPTKQLFDSPLHPYTKGLVDAIPKLTSFDSAGIPGSIPDYGDPPNGCRFHPRCPAYMAGECDADSPPTVTVTEADGDRGPLRGGPDEPQDTNRGNDHGVACFLYEQGMTAREASQIAASDIVYDAPTEDREVTVDE